MDKRTNIVKFDINCILPNRQEAVSTIYVKPNPSIKEFDIDWDISSSDFTTQGKLKVTVIPEIKMKDIFTDKLPLPQSCFEDSIEDILNYH